MFSHRVTEWAAAVRRLFDRTPERLGSVTTVAVLGTLTAITAALQGALLERGCAPLPISLIRLEVTFSASRFFSIFNSAGACAPNVERSFVTWDVVFPLAYGAFLSALYLWAERWRRFGADDVPCPVTGSLRRDLFVIAPLVAAAFDILVENPGLWFAGRFLSVTNAVAMPLVNAAVLVGSVGALVKWLLLLLSVCSIVAELLSGPRGAILWRVRFSALAVALGAVPLLAIPQGQDILQRLFEGDHPAWRLLAAVPPLIFGAVGTWYFGRKLTELRLDVRPAPVVHGWYEFFGEHIPRVLGITALVLSGIAFARAGDIAGRYVAVAGVVFFVALLARRFLPGAVRAIGRLLLPRAWEPIPALDERLGQCVLASACSVLVAVPPFSVLLPTLYLRIAAYLCLVSAWFFELFVAFRRSAENVRLARIGAPIPARPAINSVDLRRVGRGLNIGVAAAFLASLVFLIAFTTAPVAVGRALGPLWILSLTVVNAVFFGSVTVWAGRRFSFPFVSASLLLLLLFSIWNDSHTVRTIGDPIAGAIANRPSIDEQFSEWLKTSHDDGLPADVPVVLVAGAGGGLRAAYWTAISLAAIADAVPSFEDHFFAFSGVSGGSLGGALFAAIARDRRAAGGQLKCAPPVNEPPRRSVTSGFYATCVHDFMRDDFLSPVLAKLVAPDFLQLFLPFPIAAFDRSRGLEGSLETSYLRATGQPTFTSGFLAFARAARPAALVLNSTHVETGRRYMASSVYGRRDQGQPGRPLQDAGDILDVLHRDLPLSSAVHNSARFTYVSPAGHLDAGDGKEYGRVVDGGYFENSGLTSLREVYDRLRARGAMPYVVYLCNDPPACDSGERSMNVPSSAADEIVSPIRALLHTRDARGSLAQANLNNLAGDRFLQMNVCKDLPVEKLAVNSESTAQKEQKKEQTKERVVAPPLGWLLSRLARDWMDASLEGAPGEGSCYSRNARAIDILRKALNHTPRD